MLWTEQIYKCLIEIILELKSGLLSIILKMVTMILLTQQLGKH